MKTDVLVIGGSAAGIMAAITAKRHYPKKEITVVRKEEKVMIPCGIPYTMATVAGPENNLIGDGTLTDKNIKLVIAEVVDINQKDKIVNLNTSSTIYYKKLVLATGSKPFIPPIKGVNLNGVYSIDKDFKLLQTIKKKLVKNKEVVIIGGGFIGLEFADEFRKNKGVKVTIVEIMDRVLSLVCDENICQKAENKLMENNIDICCNTKVTEIIGEGKVEGVKLSNDRIIPADMVILATGVKPNISLAEIIALNFDQQKGIIVDEYMRTSNPEIFACGDCVEKPSFLGQNFSSGRLASIATNEGRVAGANLFELRRKKQNSIGIFSTIIDDLAIGIAGITKKQAEKAGIKVVIGQAEAGNRHPGGMPGCTKIQVTLLFNSYDESLIGAQVLGGDSVGELLNILGLALAKKMTAEDLAILQVGTHPALTASPIAYQIINAAEDAVTKIKNL